MKPQPTATGFVYGNLCVDVQDSDTVRIANKNSQYEVTVNGRRIHVKRITWRGGSVCKTFMKVEAVK